MYSSSDCRAITSSGSGNCSLVFRKSWEKMSRICSSRKLNSRPFFSVAVGEDGEMGGAYPDPLGSELRVNPIEEVVATKSKTAGRVRRG